MDVIETSDNGKLRVILEPDLDCEAPAYDGSAYVYDLDYRHGWDVETVATGRPGDPQAERIQSALVDALAHFGARGHDLELVTRYLRIYFGVIRVEQYDRRSGGMYLAVTTADHLEEWGISASLAQSLDNLADWRAWDEGECYGYRVQELVTWTREDTGESHDEWGDTDESCWGYVGREYAEESAREALAGYRV